MDPAFVTRDSHVSLSFKVTGQAYDQHVVEIRNGAKKVLTRERTVDRRVPLYNGYRSKPHPR